MPDMSAYPNLFSPFILNGRTLANRIVHAAMSTQFAVGGRVSDRLIDYHANRARGGAAMTVTEPLNMLARQTHPTRVDIYSGVNADALRRWAAAVASYDCLLIGQIQDAGRGRHRDGRNNYAIGASALADDLSWTVPHALLTSEIEQVIAEFAYSARLLKEAGFAGVEISAGHGHLFHQFMSARANRREDRFGGDRIGRTRLLTELIAAVRAECGADFIVGAKLPGEDGLVGGVDMAEAAAITAIVAGTGQVDYLSWCWGSHSRTLYWHLPNMHGPRTPYIDKIAELSKSAPGIATGALGLITDPNEGERIVRDGLADLVMLGRPLVTDPAWPRKARQGREAEIRYCVSCNTCWHMITSGGAIQCDNNPRVGLADDADWVPSRASTPRRIVVVGSGVAGMEAAWIAAARGHDVTVLGASGHIGGKARLHALLPGGESLSSVYDYQQLAAERHGAKFRLGSAATLEDVLALSPDAVILATGSTASWPDFLPPDYEGEGLFPDLREAAAAILEIGEKQAGTAVIFDEDHGAFTYAAAEAMLPRFERVVILTSRERIAADEPIVNRQGIYQRLYEKGAEILTSVVPLPSSPFEDGVIVYANIHNGQEGRIDDVRLATYATPRTPNDRLAAPLRAAGVELYLIGDCAAPRSVLIATSEGHALGNLI